MLACGQRDKNLPQNKTDGGYTPWNQQRVYTCTILVGRRSFPFGRPYFWGGELLVSRRISCLKGIHIHEDSEIMTTMLVVKLIGGHCSALKKQRTPSVRKFECCIFMSIQYSLSISFKKKRCLLSQGSWNMTPTQKMHYYKRNPYQITTSLNLCHPYHASPWENGIPQATQAPSSTRGRTWIYENHQTQQQTTKRRQISQVCKRTTQNALTKPRCFLFLFQPMKNNVMYVFFGRGVVCLLGFLFYPPQKKKVTLGLMKIPAKDKVVLNNQIASARCFSQLIFLW